MKGESRPREGESRPRERALWESRLLLLARDLLISKGIRKDLEQNQSGCCLMHLIHISALVYRSMLYIKFCPLVKVSLAKCGLYLGK